MVLPVDASLRSYRFRPASPQSGHLARPRLTSLLDAKTLAHPTTMVVAPSGYGKTSAVAEWAAQHQDRVAWLTLGPFDAEENYLGTSVVQALQTLARTSGSPDLSGLLAIDVTEVGPAVAFDLVAEALVDASEPLYLVIDDAHRARDELSRGLLGAVLEGGCEPLRVVVVGTSYVEIAMSKLALLSPDAVLNSRELAFDLSEVERLYHGDHPPFASEAILEETGGWPIALRFVRMTGVRPDPVAGDRDILLQRYFDEHVLGSLPTEIAAFVRSTAICSVLTTELAVAVTGDTGAGEMLERCTRMGLFLDRFETPAGPLYRWHDVVSRQCERILQQREPERRLAILRAAAAHLSTDDPLASARFWARAGDTDAAVRTVLACWVRLVVGSGAGPLDQWCATLSLPHADDPRILMVRACAQDVMGNRELALMLSSRAEARAAEQGDVPGFDDLRGRAQLFLLDDRTALNTAIAQVWEQLAAPDRVEIGDRAALQYLLGWSELRHRTPPTLTVQLFSAAAVDAEAIGDAVLSRRSLSHLALALAWSGQFRRANAVLAQRVEIVDDGSWASYAGGSAETATALIAYWRDDHETAIEAAQRAIHSGGSATSFPRASRMLLAFSAAASRDLQMCQRAAREIQGLPTETLHGVEWQTIRHAALATLHEAAGRRDLALKLVSLHENATNTPLITVVLAGIASRAGNAQLAVQMLRRMELFETFSYVRVSRLLAEAVVLSRGDRKEQARLLIEEALDVAAPEDLRRPFAGGGLEARRLLAEHLAWGTPHEDFVTACLAPRTASGPLRSLSDRERDVFAQLRTTKTMQEIAVTMGLSINTIKTHQRAIYRKLGVASRREATRQFA